MPISSLAPPPPDIPGPSSTSSHSRSHSVSASASTSTHSHAQSNPSTSSLPPLPLSPETTRQIAEARTALNVSIQNIFTPHEHALKLRAQNLHQNSSALTKQENELKKEIGKLGKEGDKLEKVVKEGQRKVKELGNVQNWAEVLERDFLVVEEVLRLVDGESEGWSGSESDWSEYETNEGGGREGSVGSNGSDGRTGGGIDTLMTDANAQGNTSVHETDGTHPTSIGQDKGKGKEGGSGNTEHMGAMDTEESSTSTNVSRSEPSSSSIQTSTSGMS
ncbi:uncharacterized protein EAF01_005903 [Botrytis porri]|uniref:Biogenesis of lysosome-related organelles complex 1 subunit 1 n=1 Tax=Botrytis porri TaxID=87229 RepID=A0A4Z1L6N4_9HELO|nr:uncharacterized protein EAF01_005903 [Botrytis porri]KAF7905382.1 hypothetical protein EAF01_005903 [Botrytis porri]TGO92326.1 hypothetical protein BPOR_0005g00150 [Botrytis porri]